jgi:hypothetical protein
MKIGPFEFKFKASLEAVRVTCRVDLPMDVYGAIGVVAAKENRTEREIIRRAMCLYEWTRANTMTPGDRLCAVTKRGVIKGVMVFDEPEPAKDGTGLVKS